MGGGCLSFSVVEFKMRLLRNHYKSCGLKSELIELDNGTTMHCWSPTPPIAEKGVWSVPAASKPSLLLIHGFAANGMLCWENQISSFVKDFNVYVPDLIFFGESTTTSKERTESFQAECMVKMLQFLGVQNEVDVVGTSYGGMVAFRMAQMYPKFVKRVVFSSSGVCMGPDNNDILLKKHSFQHISELLIPATTKEMKIAIASVTYKTPWIPDFVYNDIHEVLYKEHRAERRELLDDLVIGTAAAVPLPKLEQENMLIVWGEHDEIFNVELAYKLQKLLSTGTEVIIMKNCGHTPQSENPKEYNHILGSFLRSRADAKVAH